MKLYASITGDSKRKGQGADHVLNIEVSVSNAKLPRFLMCVTRDPNGDTRLALVDRDQPIPKNVLYETTIKGTTQQDTDTCAICDAPLHKKRCPYKC